MLPKMLADMTGADGIFCFILGLAGGILLLGLIQGNVQYMQGSYYEYLKKTMGQIISDIFMVFYLLYFIILAGYVLYQLDILILSWLLPKGNYWTVEVLLLLLAAYGTFRGIEGRVRIYEILFWFLGIPLLIMLIFAAGSVDTDMWTPIFSTNGKEYMKHSITVWSYLLPLSGLLFLKQFVKKPEKLVKSGKIAVVAVTVLNMAVYLILIGNFGQKTVQILKHPVITLMGMVDLPSGFFTRQDVTMTAIWFFALFALLHTGVFQGTLIMKQLCNEKKSNCSMWVILILIFFIGDSFIKNGFMKAVFEAYQERIALPGVLFILIAVPLVYRVRGFMKKREGGKKSCENQAK